MREESRPRRDELYAARMERFRAVALKRGPGIDADVVATAVEHALTATRPKARYLVGRDAHLRVWIERLPTRLRDRVLTKALTGLTRRRVVHAAAEPLVAEAAHLVHDGQERAALLRQRVLDARR